MPQRMVNGIKNIKNKKSVMVVTIKYDKGTQIKNLSKYLLLVTNGSAKTAKCIKSSNIPQ
jgi:hypothetical protein